MVFNEPGFLLIRRSLVRAQVEVIHTGATINNPFCMSASGVFLYAKRSSRQCSRCSSQLRQVTVNRVVFIPRSLSFNLLQALCCQPYQLFATDSLQLVSQFPRLRNVCI